MSRISDSKSGIHPRCTECLPGASRNASWNSDEAWSRSSISAKAQFWRGWWSAANPSAPVPPMPPSATVRTSSSLQGQRQNSQCQALTGSDTAVSGRGAAIPQLENPAQPARQTLQNHSALPSQTGSVPAPGLIAKRGIIPISPV